MLIKGPENLLFTLELYFFATNIFDDTEKEFSFVNCLKGYAKTWILMINIVSYYLKNVIGLWF